LISSFSSTSFRSLDGNGGYDAAENDANVNAIANGFDHDIGLS